MTTRTYPVIPPGLPSAKRPISFICVRFSGDYEHNILLSDCIYNPLNQFITVDNRSNLFFPNLCSAINSALPNVMHDLVAVVHEDVMLPKNWQAQLEASLHDLEKTDPYWHLAGAVGWNEEGKIRGHWSDPHQYINTLEQHSYDKVDRLDEQLLIFRKPGFGKFDSHLHSIHNIGKDLSEIGRQHGLVTYAVNAPTIHKLRDEKGELINTPTDSVKISDRKSLTYLADKSCSDDYLHHKWDLPRKNPAPTILQSLSPEQRYVLRAPVILLGRGGSGTRLLSEIAQNCNLFIGNNVNASGDCIDLVHQVYRGIIRKYQGVDPWLKSQIIPDLLGDTAVMLQKAEWPARWGFKLPETVFLLPELRNAFPNATYVFFSRDPENTVLRRSHMTARLDNHIGRCALGQAYDFFGYDRAQILTDTPLDRMATTTMHQIQLIKSHLGLVPNANQLTLTFEETIENPSLSLEQFSHFTGLLTQSDTLTKTVDQKRAKSGSEQFSPDEVQNARQRLQHLLAFKQEKAHSVYGRDTDETVTRCPIE